MIFAANPTAARADVAIGLSVNFGPPPIPYYVQPPDPIPNYIWSPGYWAYAYGGYYWVPGTWVPAPEPGLYWTPGYWAWNDGHYYWYPGYWAPEVGYYGGVNYGYGYYGNGYVGGAWYGDRFRYNTAVTNVNRTVVRNVFVNRTVVVNNWNRVSYNGGRGGTTARPTWSQLAVQRGHRIFATSTQVQHQRLAAGSRASFAAVNHGHPATLAISHPFNSTHRPAGNRPIAAQGWKGPIHAQTGHIATVHAAPQHAVFHHAAVVQHAAVQHAVVQHVPVQHAVVQHAAVQHTAPQHADTQHDKNPK
jgi:hypothetical protein